MISAHPNCLSIISVSKAECLLTMPEVMGSSTQTDNLTEFLHINYFEPQVKSTKGYEIV